VKPVTRYQANDGAIFKTEADALKRDSIIEQVKEAMRFLPELPKDKNCDFANGAGYYQHDPKDIVKTKKLLLEVFKSNGFADHWTGLKNAECEEWQVHPSFFLRMLDGGCAPLEFAYSRLYKIDELGREFGQPFYANNPDKAQLFERSVTDKGVDSES